MARKARKLIINVSAAKAQLSRLVDEAAAGVEIVIGKAGRPMVRLVKYETVAVKRKPGSLRGKIKIAKDFDDLPGDIAQAFGVGED